MELYLYHGGYMCVPGGREFVITTGAGLSPPPAGVESALHSKKCDMLVTAKSSFSANFYVQYTFANFSCHANKGIIKRAS